MSPRLAALFLMTSFTVSAEPPPMAISLEQPFPLVMGESATGPDGLSFWFNGSGPSFRVTQAGHELALTWAKAPAGAPGPVARALFGDFFLTVEAMPDDDHVRLRLSRAKFLTLAWGKPLELPWCAFAKAPDQSVWFVGHFEGSGEHAWLDLARLEEPGSTPTGHAFDDSHGKAEARVGDLLVAVEHARTAPRGLRLTLRKPADTVHPLVLGKPFSLIPDESASGAGLTLRLEGYGHKIKMDGSDLAYVEISLVAGGERRSMRFWQEPSPEPEHWLGFEVRMTACEDGGPPHSATARSTFVVSRQR